MTMGTDRTATDMFVQFANTVAGTYLSAQLFLVIMPQDRTQVALRATR